MDTRVLQEQRLEAMRKSKKRKAPLLPRRLCWSNAKRNSRRTVAGQSTPGRTGLVAKRHTRSRSLAQRGAISAHSWMTTAPPLRAPELRWNQQSPGIGF